MRTEHFLDRLHKINLKNHWPKNKFHLNSKRYLIEGETLAQHNLLSAPLPVDGWKNERRVYLQGGYAIDKCILNKLILEHVGMTILVEAKYPSGIYLFKVNIGNTRTMCEIYSKLTIKMSERRQLVSLPFTLIRFHALSWCFHCWTSQIYSAHQTRRIWNWRKRIPLRIFPFETS